MSFTVESFEIVGPALAASLLVAAVHAPLGLEVLRRGIIFIDLAIAQIAGVGVVAAGVLLHHPNPFLVQGVALSFAILAGVFFRVVERYLPEKQEAIIGSSFVVAASVSLLLLADHPHGGEEIQHLLSGQILFAEWREIALHVPVYAGILTLWFLVPKIARASSVFYLLFAVAITSSVQLVGVYVVFASLILPALAAIDSRSPHLCAWVLGGISAVLGVASALIFDAPAGPMLVITYAIVGMLALLLVAVTKTNARKRTLESPEGVSPKG